MGSIAGDVLLERERELGALAELIEAAARGSGCAALIEGEAGIGKTALIAAAAALGSEAGMEVLSARAGELERDFAWGVVGQLFDARVARAPAGERAALLGGAAALARPALGIGPAEAAADASYATLHGLYWLTVNLAEKRPVLLAVDDAHWADQPSLRLLAHLLPRLGELPILLLLASRPAEAEPGPATELLMRMALEPALTSLRPAALSEGASVALVRDQLSTTTSDDVCAACHDLSGGNPFLLRALIAELADEGDEAVAASEEHLRRLTPAAVSTSVLLRLARLPAGALALARAVAILGVHAELRIARLVAQLDSAEVTEAAAALMRAGILAGGDTLDFVHPLVRSAVNGDLSSPERSVLHQRAARLLDAEGAPVEQVASHLLESLPDGDDWTVERLRAAAADALGRGAPEIAARYLQRAAAEPPCADARAEVLFELGQAKLVQDPALSTEELREALELATGARRRAEIALALGEALALVGLLRDAIPVLSGALAELEPGGRAELDAALTAAQLGAARWEPSAQGLRHELVEALRRRAAAGEPLDWRLHGQLAIEAAAEGSDRSAAIEHARAALAGEEQPTGAATSAVPEAMLVLVFADLADEAHGAIEDWLALARARAWPLAAALGATVATLAALYRGDVSEAVASARGAVAPGSEMRLAPVSVGFLVDALAERGDYDLARAELAGHGLDGDLPEAWATTPLLLARGRLHAAAGDHSRALADLLASGERAEAWGVRNPAMHPWRSSAAVSLAVVGRHDEARRLAGEEVELARAWGAPRAIGVALRAAGLAHDGDRGIELLRQAVTTLASSPAPLEHARALTDLGSALRRAGHRAEARDHLSAGLDLAHRLGGIAVADRAREELTIAGARPRRDALRGRDSLTPGELRVAQQAAAGRTNREIAEALFLTLRTVETHLTSSYTKLGIKSRRELAAALDGDR